MGSIYSLGTLLVGLLSIGTIGSNVKLDDLERPNFIV